ncbi:MAG: hypothetical protein H6738_06190 [Alphaproteobacteria bacterium]|nr:hypothetical protein [Alphaproteobacteria bacterium]MCB9696352.1 hypothetical protein [Alphaproteobacteria bacterium]
MWLSWMVAEAYGAPGRSIDCVPVSKQLQEQVLRGPVAEEATLIVVEDSVCDEAGVAPQIAPSVVVPPEQRRVPTQAEHATAHAEGRSIPVLGHEDFVPAVARVVGSVDDALHRPPSSVESRGQWTVVAAGDASFLDQLVSFDEERCSYSLGENGGWTVAAAKYCILDQNGGRNSIPRRMFSSWAEKLPVQRSRSEVPLLDALIGLYEDNGVHVDAVLFMGFPVVGSDGLPARRLSVQVHHQALPPQAYDPSHGIQPYDPDRPRKVPHEIPGDTDEPQNPAP